MSKPCPECKSVNTRQMDQSFGDRAYCLSCYHQFKSVCKVVIKSISLPKEITSNDVRYAIQAIKDLRQMRSRMMSIESRLISIAGEVPQE